MSPRESWRGGRTRPKTRGLLMTMNSIRSAGAQQGLKAWGGHSWTQSSAWLVTEGSWGRAPEGQVGWVGLLLLFVRTGRATVLVEVALGC